MNIDVYPFNSPCMGRHSANPGNTSGMSLAPIAKTKVDMYRHWTGCSACNSSPREVIRMCLNLSTVKSAEMCARYLLGMD